MTLSDRQLEQIAHPLWFCLKTPPKHEHLAAAGLRKISGVQVLAPHIRYRKATRRGPVWFVEALFPGYVFARFFFPELHRQIGYLPGVSSFVRFGKSIAVIDDDTIESLRQKAGSQELIIIPFDVKPNDAVEIATGPFQGLTAVVTQPMQARERVKVLLEFLGRSLEAEVGYNDILPSGSAKNRPARWSL
jgi:transcription antitermination factor NusG